MSQSVDDLLRHAVAAARAGQKNEARRLLIQVLKADPRSEQAWIWMSSVVDQPAERIHCLKQVLSINPGNDLARRGLQALGALPEEPRAERAIPRQPPASEPIHSTPVVQPPPPLATPSAPIIEPIDESPPAPARIPAPVIAPFPPTTSPATGGAPLPSTPPPTPGGVPLIDDKVLAYAHNAVSPLLTALAEADENQPELGIVWARPQLTVIQGQGVVRRRRFRVTPLMGAIAGSIVLVIASVLLVSRLVSAISTRIAAFNSTPAPTVTITPTPADTPTPRPTRTPTPTGGPALIEPTLPSEDAPRGDLRFGALTPTPLYIATPHRTNPRMADAIMAYHVGRYSEALELIEQARQTGDDPIDAYYYEVMSLVKLGDFAHANEILQDALGRDDAFAPLHMAQGLIHESAGAYAQARLEYERARDLDPRLVEVYGYLAELYLAEGDFEMAMQTVNAGRAIRKWDVNLIVLASRTAYASRDFEQAAALANLAHYIDPSSEAVALAQARGRLALGLADLAVVDLEDYLYEVYPSSAEGWALLGQIYNQQGRQADAQMAYARALQLSPGQPVALYGQGVFYLDRGDYVRAYESLSAALAARPDDTDILLAHARTAVVLGEFDPALADLSIVRERLPGISEIETLYAHTLIALGHTEEVISLSAEALALEMTPDEQAAIYEARGWAYYLEGDYASALEDMNRALSQSATGTRYYYRGQIYQALGETGSAIRDFEWVLFWDQVFDYNFAEDAAAQLDALYAAQAEEREGSGG
jgi:tetratricopeptide (TPR) repeat protein